MIHFTNENIPAPQLNIPLISRWIHETAAVYHKKIGDIHFVFCDDEKILQVNRQYLEHDYFTDIITFDQSIGNKISGTLFISIDTVSTNAESLGNNFNDELNRVLIHGILHLCGQHDHTTEERAEMTRKENLALESLKGQNNSTD